MYLNKIYFNILLILSFLMSGCNYFKMEKINREDVKAQELENIKKEPLRDYPEIYACENKEDAKDCFERQLNEHLGIQLEGVVVNENETTKDTLWLTVNVSETGVLSLKPLDNVLEEYTYLYDTIQKSLKDISPIKPAYIKGVNVNCNFKLPLVIKNID